MCGEQKSIFTGLFSSSSSGSREVPKKPLSVVTQGTAPKSSDGPFGEKDVSILKLDGYDNLPTLPITGDADVACGQPLYVDGYPGGAENGNLENLSTPTVTAGSVSARKTSDAGVPLIETTATVSGGNSGGPGFDQDGAMIGVVSYGTSSNGASYNSLIGSSVAQQFLREKNIQPRESSTTHTYDVALNDYYRHYCKRAPSEFQQVKALYPGDPRASMDPGRRRPGSRRSQVSRPSTARSPRSPRPRRCSPAARLLPGRHPTLRPPRAAG